MVVGRLEGTVVTFIKVYAPPGATWGFYRQLFAFSWKLNSNVLKGKTKEELQKDIKLYLSENDNGEVSSLMVWDASKAVLRGEIIAKLALQKRLKQEKLNELEK